MTLTEKSLTSGTPGIKSKLPGVGHSIFSVMSALAREHQAINLSQGFPDFPCPEVLQDLAAKYIRDGYNQYAPMPGAAALRERIAEIISRCYGVSYDPDQEITVTAGATQAIYTAIATFVHAGDEVIIFEPAYDCYRPAIELHGATVVVSELSFPGYHVNWEDLEKKISKRTRAIILNSPHNPTGAVFNEGDIRKLENLVSGKNILVISDEVYEHMVFDGRKHQSLCASAALRRQSIVVSSFGKTVHTTGWKIGYVAASPELTAEFRKVHQFLVFVVNHPLQLAIAEFLGDSRNYSTVHAFYQQKRDRFLALVKGSRLQPLPCEGTYFQLMSYEGISEESDTDFAVRLTREHKLAAIPLSAFYNDGIDRKILRFCFAKKEETLEKAAAILRAL